MIKVLFVCLGNICRSPLGEGIFRHLVTEAGLAADFVVDSAGTGDWHVGSPPHPQSLRAARDRGVDLSQQRARQVTPDDLECYDYVIAMDSQNEADLRALDPAGRAKGRLVRMMEFAPERGLKDVPDPYFGGPEGFDQVYELVEAACRALLARIVAEHRLSPQTSQS